jgi:hypothetical protein
LRGQLLVPSKVRNSSREIRTSRYAAEDEALLEIDL